MPDNEVLSLMFLDIERLLFINDSVTITSAVNKFLITSKYGEDSYWMF